MGAGVAPAGVLLLTKKRTFFPQKKKIPIKISHSPQYFKMMVLLLYIQNQDKQKMTQKKIKSNFPKKKNPNPAITQNNPKNPSKTTKNFATHHNFFFTSNEQDTRKKKNNQKKTNQAREKEITFLFLTPRFRKKRLQLSCKIQGNTKSKLTRKTKILQKNPMKYTHKKVELKKKKSSEKKNYYYLFPFCCTTTCKTYLNRNLN